MKFSSWALCLFIPIITVLTIGALDSDSGIGMIVAGVFTLIVTFILKPILCAVIFLFPFALAALIGLLVYALRKLDKDKIQIGDYACAVVSGACALFLIFSYGGVITFSLTVAMAFGWFAYHMSREEEETPRRTRMWSLGFFAFVFMILSVMGYDINDANENKEDIHALYAVKTHAAFIRDDQIIMEKMNEGGSTLAGRLWMFHDAPSAPSYPHPEGGEVVDSGGRVEKAIHCRDGEFASKGFRNVAAALGRRLCAKRLDPSL